MQHNVSVENYLNQQRILATTIFERVLKTFLLFQSFFATKLHFHENPALSHRVYHFETGPLAHHICADHLAPTAINSISISLCALLINVSVQMSLKCCYYPTSTTNSGSLFQIPTTLCVLQISFKPPPTPTLNQCHLVLAILVKQMARFKLAREKSLNSDFYMEPSE